MFKKTFVRALVVCLAAAAIFSIFAFFFGLFDKDKSLKENKDDFEYVPDLDQLGVDRNIWQLVDGDSHSFSSNKEYLFFCSVDVGETADFAARANGVTDLSILSNFTNESDEEVIFVIKASPGSSFDSQYYYERGDSYLKLPEIIYEMKDGVSDYENLPASQMFTLTEFQEEFLNRFS